MSVGRFAPVRTLVLDIATALVVTACSGAAPTPSPSPTAAATPEPTAVPSEAPASATPRVFAPATSVTLQFDDNAQTALVGDNGRRIFIDVFFYQGLPKPAPGPDDILLTTHRHDDHYLPDFVESFPGTTLTDKPGTIEFDDVKITGIAAAHDVGQMGSDHIFIIDFAGLRIVHFGDCGQAALTDDQLAVIGPGKVDVAISQTYNELSGMDASNQRGVKMMQQVQPKIFIPTHNDGDTIAYAASLWPTTYSTKPITLRRSMIPASTTMLIMGRDATFYSTALNLEPAGW
jgi:hypothetical protein